MATAKDCGKRLKQIRMMKGMSQEEMAELLGYTVQTISSYENKGINKLDVINEISKKLGEDLQKNPRDNEGSIGEIGKEMLRVLVENGGQISAAEMLDSLYGLNKEIMAEEGMKLESIGICEREQYYDFSDNDRDDFFITAKGIIAYSNLYHQDADLRNQLKSVKSWEKRIEKQTGEAYDSYQAMIDDREVEKLVRALRIDQPYKIDFILYLKNHYISDVDGGYIKSHIDKYIFGETAYCDVVNRAVNNITYAHIFVTNIMNKAQYGRGFDKKNLEDLSFFCGKNDYEQIISDTNRRIISNDEYCKQQYKDLLDAVYKSLNDDSEYIKVPFSERVIADNQDFTYDIDNNQILIRKSYFKDLIHLLENEEIDIMSEAGHQLLWIDEKEIGSDGFIPAASYYKMPTDIIELQEYKKFIDENYHSFTKVMEVADVDLFVRPDLMVPDMLTFESEIDETLKRIIELEPSVLSYFRFSKEWEENGLADEVRSVYGVTKEMVEEAING